MHVHSKLVEISQLWPLFSKMRKFPTSAGLQIPFLSDFTARDGSSRGSTSRAGAGAVPRRCAVGGCLPYKADLVLSQGRAPSRPFQRPAARCQAQGSHMAAWQTRADPFKLIMLQTQLVQCLLTFRFQEHFITTKPFN